MVRKNRWYLPPNQLTHIGYAKQKGIIGWPVGVGWPRDTSAKENVESLTSAESSSKQEAQSKLASAKAKPSPDTPNDVITQKYGLGHCNIWIGTTTERDHSQEPPSSKRPLEIDESWKLDNDAGIMLIYLPLLPNEKCPGVIPESTEYMSTWNFQYTPEQIDSVIGLAERNFEVGEQRIRRAIKAMWMRKREVRLEKEREERIFEKGRSLVRDTIVTLHR
jgi:cytosolic phospholipase A2